MIWGCGADLTKSRVHYLGYSLDGGMPGTREIVRILEREAEKGKSTPLKFVGLQFPDQAYGKIKSPEQLEAQIDFFLRIGDFKPQDDRGCNNNAYFHRGLFNRKELTCSRFHNEMQRKECKYMALSLLRPKTLDYDKIICEKVLCEFFLDDAGLEKSRYIYEGNETYAFLLSHTYLLNLYELCRKARLSVAKDEVDFSHLKADERRHVTFEDVRTGIFQALLFDDVSIVGNSVFVKMYSIMILE